MAHRHHLIHWLKEAYALEEKLETMLGKQADDLAENFTVVSDKLREHQQETRVHSELVAEYLKSMGEGTSDLKAMGGKAMAMIEGVLLGLSEDRVVKYSAAGFAIEHFEIAHYTAIRTAAQELDEKEIVAMCDRILKEEQRMADWIEKNAEQTVKDFLAHSHQE